MARTKWSEHISIAESSCHCSNPNCPGKGLPPDPSVVGLFEALRQAVGLPIIILRCWSCPPHSLDVGGASNDLHTIGAAVDVEIPPREVPGMFYKLASMLVGDGGLGWGPNKKSIHIDWGHLLGCLPHRRWTE